jgi:nucleotide-binding universal stress UspA family protein
MGYQKILLALDINETGTALFEEALDLALKMGAELTLFCCFAQDTVAEMEGRVATFSELNLSDSERIHENMRQVKLEHVRAWLESLAKLAAERGVAARADAEEGNPAQRICDAAADWGADLIVLGHHSRRPLKELLLGSLSSHVIRDAPCSVLLVKQK